LDVIIPCASPYITPVSAPSLITEQYVSGTENGNVTTKGNVFLNQTKDTTGNQTVLAINSTNTTSANGTNAEILTNASQQPLATLQPLRGLLLAPSQSQQQQQPSTLQQQQPSTLQQQQPSTLQQQQPSTLQQQQPPLPSPLNLIPPRSSPQQQNPLSLMQPSLQLRPPIGGPLDQLGQTLGFQQPSTMHIVGEVLNQAPVTAKSVKIIATFYNASQVKL
jgi:hypothetical protein